MKGKDMTQDMTDTKYLVNKYAITRHQAEYIVTDIIQQHNDDCRELATELLTVCDKFNCKKTIDISDICAALDVVKFLTMKDSI